MPLQQGGRCNLPWEAGFGENDPPTKEDIPMADAPVQLIVAAFQDENGAEAALNQLKEAKKEKLVNIKDAAVLRKDQKGDLHIKETGDMTGKRGAAIGGVVGLGLGILTGGASLALTAGAAAAGGVAAKLRDSGFKDERLRRLGAGLKPGSSVIVAVIEHTWVSELEADLQRAGAEIVVESIAADVAAQLDAGNEVAYTAIADSQGGVAARVVASPEGEAKQVTSPEGEAKPSS
jgi:uncharacterized membrane protein